MTGYQISDPKNELLNLIQAAFNDSKNIRFMQFSLRSALTVFKNGGFVTGDYKERNFSLCYDNKRQLIEKDKEKDNNLTFFESIPHHSVQDCLLIRKMAQLHRTKYNERYPMTGNTDNQYSSYIKIMVRMLVRLLYQEPDLFNLNPSLKISRLIIYEIFNSMGVRLSLNYISQQKTNPFIPYSVPRTISTEEFLIKFQGYFPNFKSDKLFRRSK